MLSRATRVVGKRVIVRSPRHPEGVSGVLHGVLLSSRDVPQYHVAWTDGKVKGTGWFEDCVFELDTRPVKT